MKKSIEDSLRQIDWIRSFNKNLKLNIVKRGTEITKKKKKILNLEKVINAMSLLKTVHKTIPAINDLVESRKYQYAIDLLSNSEETYNQ